MLEQYNTIYEGGEGEIIEKKSRFIATVRLVKNRGGSLKLHRRNAQKILECHPQLLCLCHRRAQRNHALQR